MAIQTGQINIGEALDFIQETDVSYKIRKLQRLLDKKDREAKEHEQMMMQQQEQMRQQGEQMRIQAENEAIQQQEQAKFQRRTQEIDQTHQNRLRESITKERMNALK